MSLELFATYSTFLLPEKQATPSPPPPPPLSRAGFSSDVPSSEYTWICPPLPPALTRTQGNCPGGHGPPWAWAAPTKRNTPTVMTNIWGRLFLLAAAIFLASDFNLSVH